MKGKILDDLEPLKRRYREYPGIIFTWPIHDIIRYFRNLDAARLYAADESLEATNFIQQQVIDDLRKHGICVIHVSDLFPDDRFQQLRELTETYVQQPSNQEIIERMRTGARRNAPAGKDYLLKLLGDTPLLQRSNTVLQFSLDPKILAIICGYLKMFTRLLAINCGSIFRAAVPSS